MKAYNYTMIVKALKDKLETLLYGRIDRLLDAMGLLKVKIDFIK